MGDEKHRYEVYESAPIPTYEEATSSRTALSQTHRGPEEISDDAERQGLLGQDSSGAQPRRRNGDYQAPTVESARSSVDSDLYLPEVTEEEDAGLRQDMEQMEVVDPVTDSGAQRRARLRTNLSKRITSLTTTLSSIHLPSFRIPSSISTVASRLPQIPDRYRPGLPTIARLCGLFTVVALVYVVFAMDTIPSRGGVGQQYEPESVRTYVQSHVDEVRIRDYLKHITSFDHVAGSEGNLYLARWIEGVFNSANMDAVATLDYHVYLNYPRAGGRRVAIISPAEQAWEAKLEEEPVYENPTPQQTQTMVWHGHSRAGNVTGPLIYANYGSREDFQRLRDLGIDLKGSIVLVRYYGTQGDRAMKVKIAELAGAAGCLIYSDPKDDGFIKGEPWPNGPWRPSDGVQRGAVSLMSWVVGDVLTPGWASTLRAKRVSKDNNPGLVNIPSLPLAWRDAQRLLQALKNHGEKVPEDWMGGVPDVEEWWSGDATSPVVHLKNEQDEIEKQPIYNVQGVIEGAETKAKKIIVGNHRDSWCFGAADPGSGTAVLLEVVNIFGQLRKLGWRPLRSILFNSWDGEEYNLIGSTEYVEESMVDLRENGVAYLNVDVGVSGDKFRAAASPLFERALLHALDRVSDPNKNKTLRTLWDESGSKLEGLGAGSDYVAFQDMAGTSSLDFGFTAPPGGYPYHSCYETFEWMEKFGDPGFAYHKALAQIWALLILDLADRPILPYDLNAYAAAVTGYVERLEKDVAADGAPRPAGADGGGFDMQPLKEAAALFVRNARQFMGWEDYWQAQVAGRGGLESHALVMHRIDHNARMSNFETHLLDLPGPEGDDEQHGVPGREQFKHILFGPQAWSGYDEAYFPAIRDAVDAKNWPAAQAQLDKAARILTKASEKLLPELG